MLIDTVKPAEDGSGDLILRIYEAMHAAGTAEICLNIPVQKAWLCDMLENIEEELPIADGKLVIPFGGFEIKTVRLA